MTFMPKSEPYINIQIIYVMDRMNTEWTRLWGGGGGVVQSHISKRIASCKSHSCPLAISGFFRDVQKSTSSVFINNLTPFLHVMIKQNLDLNEFQR